MRKIIKIEQSASAPLQFTWIINNICTRACSYCPENLHSGTNHNYDWQKAKVFFKKLFQRYPRIHCVVSGGEPSLSPFFREMVQIFYDAGHSIGITSNAAKPAHYWAEIAPQLNYICFSWHVEDQDPEFENKVRAAAEHTSVSVRVMMHPDYWTQCVNMYEGLHARNPNITVEAVKILPYDEKIARVAARYTAEQTAWFAAQSRFLNQDTATFERFKHKLVEFTPRITFDDGTVDPVPHMIDYINSGMANFRGYECKIGLEELYVQHDGEILLGNCGAGSIGRIDDVYNIKWPKTTYTCDRDYCDCSISFSISKWKNDDNTQ